ncbi:PP2C family protein-serine/threonine phosphatase, partial [Desulfohalovibrio reitneri]|uniref:PP2C family protein-serine/threonine phosphatase n=1 Tax=Desulfohalovibrio reitneri TaxID=1307759 RepID=UPI0004A6D81E
MRAATYSRKGLRDENQDRAVARAVEDGWLLAVADGMGGEAGGGLAAELAVAALEDFSPGPDAPAALAEAIRRADRDIHARAEADPSLTRMGTTLTAAWVAGGTVHWAHAGDSRLYIFSQGNLRQLTRDHNYAGELVAAGELSKAEAEHHPMRNVLEQCVGCPAMEPETGSEAVNSGGVLLLCSDGLSAPLGDEGLARELAQGGQPEDLARALVDKALAAGGTDNATVVVAVAE